MRLRSRLFADYHHTFNTNSGEPQWYGTGVPYVQHLNDVVLVLNDFGYTSEEWVDAGYLHDVLEDTKVTSRELRNQFGDRVTDLVEAVSGFGPNRKSRNACIYAKIADYPDAAILKVADRIANTTDVDERYRQMYHKELDQFYENVGRLAPEPMWQRLARNFT